RSEAGAVGAGSRSTCANPGLRTFRCRFLLGRQPQNPVPDFLQPGSGERKEHTANASLADVQFLERFHP
ncbi:MAG: hypothetical protein AB1584_24860, partial [Pseudomonadota bacterium]